MKFTSTVLAAAVAQSASAHYIFNSISVDGAPNAAAVRTPNNNSPVENLSSPDLRCNVGGASKKATTATAAAGSKMSWIADSPVYHQGPFSVYVSKVADASSADGSAPWWKIYEAGPTFPGGSWAQTQKKQLDFTLPSCMAPGDYLVRAEQIGLHNPGAAPQFYVACAQVKVTGGGAGLPGSGVAIPGAVKSSDAGLKVNIYNGFSSYSMPGPKVSKC